MIFKFFVLIAICCDLYKLYNPGHVLLVTEVLKLKNKEFTESCVKSGLIKPADAVYVTAGQLYILLMFYMLFTKDILISLILFALSYIPRYIQAPHINVKYNRIDAAISIGLLIPFLFR